MKYKKVGNILILDKNTSTYDLDYLANKHNVKTIMRITHIQGAKRQPVYQILWGNDTQTVNKENGCLFKLDLAKVMWSKGNVAERLRVAREVSDEETVIDMFSGIGYFSIPIARHSNPREVISIEINPVSYNFLCENIKLNKINNITPILGDCLIETPKYRADRIIMGYVKTTHHYLKTAINSLNKGGIIHYHETVPTKLMNTRPLKRIISQSGNREVELIKINKIKKYAPGVEHVVVDARIY